MLIKGKGNNKKYDLVLTHSLDGDPDGNGLNSDFVFASNLTMDEFKNEVKKNKITRAIWFANREDGYVMPKDLISGKVQLLFCW